MKKLVINCLYISSFFFAPFLYPCDIHNVALEPTPSTKPPLNQRPPTEDTLREEEEVPSSDRSRYEKHDYHDHRHDQDFRQYRYNDDKRYRHRYHHDYDDFDGSFESY